ncbi:glycoside hydrolase family 3 protein [Xylariaceae sp. FL0594]|nr:glycoside hydrolase family 3 protein [Xylariaceae sp. FL0594]
MRRPTVQTAAAAASLLLPLAAARMVFPDCVSGPAALTKNLVCDTTAKPADRASAFIKAWNTTEKLVNLVNAAQGTSRIGVPSYEWWSEALHGVAFSPGVSFNGGGSEFSSATSFATPILMSAAFDDELIHSVAETVSTEARAFSNAGRAGLDYWTPNINPYKDPRWGRGSETPGEDPFRIKGYVAALISGLQGNQNTTKVIATCKHYAAYDLERWHGLTRYEFDAIVGMQDLVEYYLPPFQQCARDSKVKSIMCSYNSVNGTPACANTYLMGTVLRDFWEWDDENQYVTSDCNAVQNFHQDHNYTRTAAQSAAIALNAGTDTICEVGRNTDVKGAYSQNYLKEEVMDRALKRLYEGLIRAGYFDGNSSSSYRSLGWKDVNTPAAQALALKSATDGIVLKKNLNSVLPLSASKNASLALIGFWAAEGSGRTSMLGGYSGLPPYYHTPASAASKLGIKTYTATGPLNQSTSARDTWTTSALVAANKADVVVYFGGTDMSVESEDLDRDSIAWPGAQLSLINKLCALGKPCIVVQLGDQSDDTPLLANKNVSSIVWAGFPGQDGGTAVLDILYGRASPAGRLPTTVYPASYVNQVPLTDMELRPNSKTGNPGRTYKWYSADPVLPYGYGLHYTTFNASFSSSSSSSKREDPSTTTTLSANQTIAIADILGSCTEKYKDLCAFPYTIPISVQNTGAPTTTTTNKTSDFVALVFVSGQFGPKPYPNKQLVAYKRLRSIPASQTATATLSVKLGELARVDGDGHTVLYPGTYTLLLDVPTSDTLRFELTGDAARLIEFPQPPKDLGAGNGHENL